jgi:hypothetical protein
MCAVPVFFLRIDIGAATWRQLIALGIVALHVVFPQPASAEIELKPSCETRHPMTDAWFTGPMLANTAATAPRGHYLAEPYLYDVITQGTYGANGVRHSSPHENSFGSLTYLIYGLTDRIGIGLIPTAGYSVLRGAPSSSGPRLGDLTVQIQRRFALFQPCGKVPTISLAVQEILPTGQYDRLGSRQTNGIGAGAYTTNPEFLSQMYFWLPNRRILRVRVDGSDAFSSRVGVQDASVYGTASGFRGDAKPGSSLYIDVAAEYSATRNWVFALDATYRNTGNTLVSGYYAQNVSSGGASRSIQTNTGWSDAYGLAPAIEYSWKPWIGVLAGIRLIPAGHNTDATISPALAINIVH